MCSAVGGDALFCHAVFLFANGHERLGNEVHHDLVGALGDLVAAAAEATSVAMRGTARFINAQSKWLRERPLSTESAA